MPRVKSNPVRLRRKKQVMKAAKGKANPQQVNDLLRQKLAG